MPVDPVHEFENQKQMAIEQMAQDSRLQELTRQWFNETCKHRYSYNFTWMGRPIIQYPQDMIVMQEIIWQIQPDLIIETGIAHGGSLIFYASLLELIGNQGQVLGIDIEIRPHNRVAIESHPIAKRIQMIEGSSIDPKIVEQVREIAQSKSKILVALDSNHTHDHVLKELELYSPLVSQDSYLVVFDTVVEDMPEQFFKDRPWGQGNNPKTAVKEFLKVHKQFEIDKLLEAKLLVSVAPEGYLRRVKG